MQQLVKKGSVTNDNDCDLSPTPYWAVGLLNPLSNSFTFLDLMVGYNIGQRLVLINKTLFRTFLA
jgi:hypothetical protein